MKTIIKLLIVIAILNAAVRAGMVVAKYYQLKDETQQLLTFGGNTAPSELQNRIVARAQSLSVPVDPADIIVTRDGLHTYATVSYAQSFEVVPNYTYPLKFQFAADAISMGGLGPNNGGAAQVR